MDKKEINTEYLLKINEINKVIEKFFVEDFAKLKDIKFKYTIRALTNLFSKISYINNGIIESRLSGNYYTANILKRTLIEAYFRHLYIFTRALDEDSDEVGKEYLLTLKSSEDLSFFRRINNYNNIQFPDNTKWSTKGEENTKIENIEKKFNISQIFFYIIKNIKKHDEKDSIIQDFYKKEYFKKYIEEYSRSSSFTHAGPYSGEILQSFTISKNKEELFDHFLNESFNLYSAATKTTFLFYSLMNTNFQGVYEKIEKIFSESNKKLHNLNFRDEAFELSGLAKELEESINSLKIWKNGEIYITKGFVEAVGDLKIYIYPKDHNPPHFHVISKQKKINARFNLDTLELIGMKFGKISANNEKKIQYHFLKRRPASLTFLKEEYNRLNKNE